MVSKSEYERSQENYERFRYTYQRGHCDHVTKAKRCDQFVYGNQYTDSDRNKLRIEERPCLTLNMIFPALSASIGEFISTRADVNFRPLQGGDPATAEAISRLFIQTSQANRLDWIEDEVFNSGVIRSRGFYDIRMDFSENMRGEIKIRHANSNNVIPDADADSYDPDDWGEVFYTRWLSPHMVASKFDKPEVAKELSLMDGSAFNFGYDSIDSTEDSFGGKLNMYEAADADMYTEHRRFVRAIERQYKETRVVEHFVDRYTGEMRPVPKEWDRDRIAMMVSQFDLAVIKKRTTVHRWITTADRFVLFDEDMPYDHFTWVMYAPYFFNGQTVGLIENQIEPQELYNKTTSDELHLVNQTANAGWQMEENQLVGMTPEELEQKGSSTALVLQRRAGSPALERIQPGTTPTGLDRLSYKAAESLKEISMVSDSKRGFDRADVAAKAIMAKQQAGSINLAPAMHNLIKTRHLVASRCLDLFQRYYTEERVYTITKNSFSAPSEEVHINYQDEEGNWINDITLGEYGVVITDVPARDTYEETQFQQALQLKELGVPIPDKYLVQNSTLADKLEIAEELSGEPSEAQKAAQQLEMQRLQLENAKMEAETLHKKADSALTMARAQTEALKSETDGAEAERERMIAELTLKREELAAQIALQREKQEAELALKEREMQSTMRLKEAEAEERLAMQKQQQQEAAKQQKTDSASET